MPQVRREIEITTPMDKHTKAEKDKQRRIRDRELKKRQLPKEHLKTIASIPEGTSDVKVALYYAKMCRDRGFLPTGLMSINPTMFPNESVCRRATLLLRNNGFIAQCDNGRYVITTRGVFAISLIAMREPSREQVTDSQGGV